jgi:hypothetical protein
MHQPRRELAAAVRSILELFDHESTSISTVVSAERSGHPAKPEVRLETPDSGGRRPIRGIGGE